MGALVAVDQGKVVEDHLVEEGLVRPQLQMAVRDQCCVHTIIIYP